MNRLLLVDLDDTLCNTSEAYAKAKKTCFIYLKKIKPELTEAKFNKLYQQGRAYVHDNLKDTASSHNRLLYFQKIFEMLAMPVRPDLLSEITELYWDTTYKNLKLFPTVKDTLKILKKSDVELGIVSNLLTSIQIKKLEKLKIAHYFDFIVCSEEVAKEKPYAPIYRLALKKSKFGKSAKVYVVGDDYQRDIVGANKMKFVSIYFGQGDAPQANFVIDKFNQVLSILGVNYDDGYIKFNFDFKLANLLKVSELKELNKYRSILYKKNLIGMFKNGVGFGNISQRYKKSKFIITGTATGNKKNLSPKDYALIHKWDFTKNNVVYSGKTAPSSESMSHAAVYESASKIRVVVHIHQNKLWSKLNGKVPTTSKKAAYGTPEMAYEIKKILKKDINLEKGIIVMGGHQNGMIFFGQTFASVLINLEKYLKQYKI